MNLNKVKGYISLGLIIPIWTAILVKLFSLYYRSNEMMILLLLAILQPMIMFSYGFYKLTKAELEEGIEEL